MNTAEIVILAYFIIIFFEGVRTGSGKGAGETICDAIVFTFIGIPLVIYMITAPFCHGWNEGTMAGKCTISALTDIYNAINGFLLLMAFGGIMIIGPIFLAAFLISWILKAGRIVEWIRGKPQKK